MVRYARMYVLVRIVTRKLGYLHQKEREGKNQGEGMTGNGKSRISSPCVRLDLRIRTCLEAFGHSIRWLLPHVLWAPKPPHAPCRAFTRYILITKRCASCCPVKRGQSGRFNTPIHPSIHPRMAERRIIRIQEGNTLGLLGQICIKYPGPEAPGTLAPSNSFTQFSQSLARRSSIIMHAAPTSFWELLQLLLLPSQVSKPVLVLSWNRHCIALSTAPGEKGPAGPGMHCMDRSITCAGCKIARCDAIVSYQYSVRSYMHVYIIYVRPNRSDIQRVV